MHFCPYLSFDGRCAEALDFYSKTLSATVAIKVPFSQMPGDDAPIPENWKEKIMHAEWKIGDQQLMACDAPPQMYKSPHQGYSINLMLDEISEAERIYEALKQDGEVQMPLEESFFAHRFAMLTDQFGIPWMIAVLKQPE
ncbi:hypothetical protein TDB9533_00207 [Thalassocella blandensis]|nr:hypothetical protein TDB9533_00207 [Thalassocella blandensis]